MFDVSFSELVVIGLVALIVIGPERLPKVARTAGLLLGRLQRYVSDVKADINREMQLDELKKMQEQIADHARAMESSLSDEMHAVHESLNQSIAPPDMEAQAQPPTADLQPDQAANQASNAPVNQMELGLDRGAEKTKA
ncbi:MAG TPA: Sec-independent protein translocase protein TatB [Rhodocyclaceae bacterium]|nr:Sec-independent protein translocase protein TatB [Rhodocyclaceae bacterium]